MKFGNSTTATESAAWEPWANIIGAPAGRSQEGTRNVFEGALWSLLRESSKWRQRSASMATRADGLRVARDAWNHWIVDYTPPGTLYPVHEARVPWRYRHRIRRAVESLGERQTLADFCKVSA